MEEIIKIEINNKYSIGDIVQKYKVVGEFKDRVICPLCNGIHFVDEPNYKPEDYDAKYDNSILECLLCDEDGYVGTNYTTKRVLNEEIYRIEGIYVKIGEDESIEYTYHLRPIPELNNKAFIHIGCDASEEDLELAKDYAWIIPVDTKKPVKIGFENGAIDEYKNYK